MSERSVLTVQGVAKSFGRHEVLRGIDLDIPAGEIVAVLGPSGSGKSTLLRLIAGFETLDRGSITIDGTVVCARGNGADVSLAPERRRVGVVPQEGALFPHLDVARNVAFGLPRGAQATERVAEVLELVGLAGLQGRRPHELSGGQQQRVALARALAPRPSLVLLDEPFSSLDAGLRAQVRDEVFDLLRAADATAVLVTHDQQEALSVADHVAVLLDGRVAQSGEPATLYREPQSLAVATFVGDAVVLPGVAAGEHVTCALGQLVVRNASRATGEVMVVVRPEQLTLGSATDSTAGARGTVVGRSYFGHDGLVRVDIGSAQVACRSAADEMPPRGAAVTVRVTSSVSTFPRSTD